ncbi:MAG: transposase family protein, partial [Oscillospiraceae bacterium]
MLYTNFTAKMLGLEDVIINNVENGKDILQIYISQPRKTHICPCCHEPTDSVHDYRAQPIKDINAFGKRVELIVKKRRYRCKKCGKRFYEANTIVPRYHRMTSRLIASVLEALRDVRSFRSVAKETHLSVSTVMRIFDVIQYPKPALPRAMGIDEFKG